MPQQLPQGFTLDPPTDLPEGFTLDTDEKPNPGGLATRGLIGLGDAALSAAREGAGLLGAGVAGITGAFSGKSLSEIGDVASTVREGIAGEPFTQAGDEVLETVGGVTNDALAGLLQMATQVGGPAFSQRIGDIAREEGFQEGVAEVTAPLGPLAQTAATVGPEIAATAAGGRNLLPGQRRLAANPAQLERAQQFADAGVTPTRANITRSGEDFKLQGDLLRENDDVRQGVAAGDREISEGFDARVADTRGNVGASSVSDEVIGRSVALDEEISQLYKSARETAGDNPVVNLDKTQQAIEALRPDNTITRGVIQAIEGRVRGFKGQPISINDAENLRIQMNSFFDSTSPQGRRAIGQLKDALDEDVFRIAGRDVFVEARRAKQNFEQGLDKAKISKFDTNRTNLVRDILESGVNADTLIDDVAFKKGKYKGRDIAQLREYLTQTGDGVTAWQNFRADVLNTIKERAFKGVSIDDGVQSITPTRLKSALDAVGNSKLKEILTTEEMAWLENIQKVTKAREPISGAINSGPSSPAINVLNRQLEQLPVIGRIIKELRINRQGRFVLDGTPVQELRTVPASSLAIPAAVGTAEDN